MAAGVWYPVSSTIGLWFVISSARSNAVLPLSVEQTASFSNNEGPMPWDAPNRLMGWFYLPTPWRRWAVAGLFGKGYCASRKGSRYCTGRARSIGLFLRCRCLSVRMDRVSLG